MTMTPWNLAHGQWSKNLTITIDTLEFLGFCHDLGQNFDHVTTVIKKILTMAMVKTF